MCNKTGNPHALRRGAHAFLADARGLAAVELAMILPLALMLLSLVVYGGQAYRVQRKVTLAATTVANIFAQANNNNQSTITQAELNQILAYPNLILYPYNGSSRRGRSVATAGHRQRERDRDRHGLRQLGQRQRNGPPDGPADVDRSVGRFRLFQLEQQRQSACGGVAANTVPTNYVVLGEVQYPFEPTGIYFPVSSMTLHNSIIMIPRVASPITVQ